MGLLDLTAEAPRDIAILRKAYRSSKRYIHSKPATKRRNRNSFTTEDVDGLLAEFFSFARENLHMPTHWEDVFGIIGTLYDCHCFGYDPYRISEKAPFFEELLLFDNYSIWSFLEVIPHETPVTKAE